MRAGLRRTVAAARPTITSPGLRFCHHNPVGSYATGPSDPLIQLLLRNPELSEEDAVNELRWIRNEVPLNADECDKTVQALVRRRAQGEPLQYILGSTDFGPLDLLCRPPVLIPRHETADITSRFAVLQPAGKPLRALDLCTGSGCIPLLLAYNLPTVAAVGIDISNDALELAADNATRCELQDRVQFSSLDVMSDTAIEQMQALGRFDIITSNPPYVSNAEYEDLPRSVKDYEDPRALLGSEGARDDGLAFYRRFAMLIPLLRNDARTDAPCVMFEIGATQGDAVMSMIGEVDGLGRCEVWNDLFGRPRAVVAWRV